MRDVLLAMLMLGVVPAVLMAPHVGAYAWAWVSLMNPHRLVWGFVEQLPLAQIVAIATLLAMVFQPKKLHSLPLNRITGVYLLFLGWMSLTSLFALNSPDIVLDRWIYVMKLHFMMLVTMALLRERKQIEALIWVVTLSLGYYGIKGGIFTVLTGGNYRVWGPRTSFVEGNNELAVALIVLIPFMVYLYRVTQRKWLRLAMAGSAVSCGIAVLGSQSRGAFLGLAAMVLFLGLKSRRPILSTVVLLTLLGIGVLSMPESWSSRMETIGTYEQDTSAVSRIYVWETMWNLALDRPLIGGGFATDCAAVFSRYAPQGFEQFSGIYWVAHSIYFQALGEHGFPGLLLYIALGVLSWRTASRLARQTDGDPDFETWVPILMRTIQVSMLGFGVGGAFLNLLHFDLPYYMVAYVVLVDVTVREHRRKAAVQAQTAVPHSRMAGVAE